MKHLSRTLPEVLALALVLAPSACQDSSAPTALLDVPVAQSVVVDFQAGNGAQFLFLPPLANGKPSAPMAEGLDLSVTICDPSAACEVLAAKEEDDHYQANWKSDKARAGTAYSVSVSGSGIPLGELTVTLESKGNDKAGSTFPIKFWVGQTLGGAIAEVSDCVGDDRCNAEAVPPGETTTIVTEDENGATMGEVVFPPAAVPAGGLIVTLDCREGGYDPGDGPLPTALDQWPLFCHVDVKNPDGSAFTGSLASNASIEICVVDELEPGQAPYHGFADHHDLVLGKSTTGSDFMFLPMGPEALNCEGATTTVASASPAGRIFDAIGSRLATLLSPILPRRLYARTMMFRDGGVGGLVSSFSDINPVEPAIIAGTVTYGAGGGGIGGVTITLGGDASAVTTTDSLGSYSFGPLQAAVGGSSYTVTVSGLPAGETLAAPSQVVGVGGSGTFAADFDTEVPAGVFYNPDNGNYYGPVTANTFWSAANAAANAMTLGSCSGHLATITSAAENAFIAANMPQAADDGYMLGGQRIAGVWTWVTGEPWSYTNWHAGEPGPSEPVLQFFGRWGTPIEQWNDTLDNFIHFGYVVEYECGS